MVGRTGVVPVCSPIDIWPTTLCCATLPVGGQLVRTGGMRVAVAYACTTIDQ